MAHEMELRNGLTKYALKAAITPCRYSYA